MAEKKAHVEKVHCNACTQQTNHRRVCSHHRNEHDGEDDGVWWSSEYDLFVCQGCGDVTLRQKERFSEDFPPASTISYYPPRVARQIPDWQWSVEDKEVLGLLKEVYVALQADARRLAMMGCRAVLDRIMVQSVGDVGTFPEKLNRMVDERRLSQADRDVLDAAIDAGSASAHRGYEPTPRVLGHVVSIVEHSVQSTLLPEVAEEIKAKTPKRPKRK
tara:strand:+ start:7058 stop:7708 length:651 start_codon:yes stop_codon:yes gene_type:complete